MASSVIGLKLGVLGILGFYAGSLCIEASPQSSPYPSIKVNHNIGECLIQMQVSTRSTWIHGVCTHNATHKAQHACSSPRYTREIPDLVYRPVQWRRQP